MALRDDMEANNRSWTRHIHPRVTMKKTRSFAPGPAGWPLGRVLTGVLALAVFAAGRASAQSPCTGCLVAFEGYPERRVTVTGTNTEAIAMRGEDSEEFVVRIVVDPEGNHFWETREMKPLVKIDSGGGYLLFLSESGYVRIRKEWAKEAMEALPAETLRDQGIDVEYDYIEHLFDHLRTFTYYGKRRS